MQITEHFTREELTFSQTAINHKIPNEPTAQHFNTLIHTCRYLLEPLRALMNLKYVGRFVGKKEIAKIYVKITSGYRSSAVNQALFLDGYFPSKTSQHCTGEAVDLEFVMIFIDGSRAVIPYVQAFNDIHEFVQLGFLSVDQCIQEKQGKVVWIHISHSAWGKTKDRKQFFSIER